jgi:hypothetical protein
MAKKSRNAIGEMLDAADSVKASPEPHIESLHVSPDEFDGTDGMDAQDPAESLGHSLYSSGFHPVLIFGTAATGKTTFLTSMLSFFTSTTDVGITITLGDPISRSTVGLKAHESSEKLFHYQVNNYLNGTAPVQNQEAFPFFVPVELRRSRNREIIRIALLESSGELWSVAMKKNYVQELREEISDVYRNYPLPMTIIMVVPYAMSEGYTGTDSTQNDRALFQDSDIALHQTLQVYQKYRPPHIRDKFCFVLTKWDLHTQVLASEEFTNPNGELVKSLVKQRFPRAFGHFENMIDQDLARCIPYSAGLIGGTKILEVPRDLKPTLDDFPYKLWGWIYKNATNGRDLYNGVEEGRKSIKDKVQNFFRELFS